MATGIAIVAAVGTAYAIYSSERQSSRESKRYGDQMDELDRARAEDVRRREEHRKSWDEALEQAESDYGADIEQYGERRDYWSDLMEDPTSHQSWQAWQKRVGQEFESAAETGREIATRRGLSGGVQQEFTKELALGKAERLGDVLAGISKEAELRYHGERQPHFNRPVYEYGGSAPTYLGHQWPVQPFPDVSGLGVSAGALMSRYFGDETASTRTDQQTYSDPSFQSPSSVEGSYGGFGRNDDILMTM